VTTWLLDANVERGRGRGPPVGDRIKLEFSSLAGFGRWWVEWRCDTGDVRLKGCERSSRRRFHGKSPRDGRYGAQKMKELLESPTASGFKQLWRAEAGCWAAKWRSVGWGVEKAVELCYKRKNVVVSAGERELSRRTYVRGDDVS
jgi:hypothetical protein